jgi:prepilin-type N-terminal cleavage/methylation domain-containing protein
MKTPTESHAPRRVRAFSLIELLVVIAILGVMAAAGTVALSNGSKSVAGAASAASTMMGLARTEAIMRRVPARLIVDTAYNSALPDNFRRRMTVVVSNDGGTTWEQVARWQTLPGSAFYNAELSKVHGQMTIAGLPGATGSATYDYFEFQPNGQATARAQFVVSRGVAPGGTFQETSATDRSGFFVHKLGKQTFFADPAQIPAPW